MLYLIIAILSCLLLYFFIRYQLLCRSIKIVNKELEEITHNIEENQILKQEAPNKELEKLLVTINAALWSIRKERITYEEREVQFQKQIENISHDLRTPLTSMLGYLKLLDSSKLEEEDKESLEIIERKVGLLNRLITQFYDFSRITSEHYRLKLEPVDVTRLLREIITGFYQELYSKNYTISIEIPEGPMWVNGNVDGLERVFLNFLQNMYRYAKDALKIKVEEKEEEVVISFENTVSDFTEYDLEHIFNRFYLKDSARSKGASGLGLTIAKYFIEKMNGTLKAELKEEEWLLFQIKLAKITV